MKGTELVSSKEEIAETLANTFQNYSSSTHWNINFLEHKVLEETRIINTTGGEEDPINLPISKEELEDAINSNKNTSSGPDNIPLIFLQKLPQNAKEHLLNIFNIIWTKIHFQKMVRSNYNSHSRTP